MIDAMALALNEARAAASRGEVPVGAVVVGPDGAVVASARNRVEERGDPTAHAEFLALRQAASMLGTARTGECDLFVTLEPCALCAAAIAMHRIKRVYFGAYDPKGGAVEHGPRLFTHKTTMWQPEVYGGIRESNSAELLQAFFKKLRETE